MTAKINDMHDFLFKLYVFLKRLSKLIARQLDSLFSRKIAYISLMILNSYIMKIHIIV
jgi:hypothetical protein